MYITMNAMKRTLLLEVLMRKSSSTFAKQTGPKPEELLCFLMSGHFLENPEEGEESKPGESLLNISVNYLNMNISSQL